MYSVKNISAIELWENFIVFKDLFIEVGEVSGY